MLKMLLAAALVAVPVPASPEQAIAPQHSGVLLSPASYREIIPPVRYQRDNAAVVIFTNADGIAALCGPRNAQGTGPIACAGSKNGTPVIAMPNPCLFADSELYAAITCHELGHVNGWGAGVPGGHGD